MKLKFVLGFAVVALSLASAKSYEVSVDAVSTVGTVQLQPGEYKVSIDGSNAKFTDVNSGKSVETPVTIETNGKSKFDATSLESQKVNGVNKVSEIDLGGTATKLKFQ